MERQEAYNRRGILMLVRVQPSLSQQKSCNQKGSHNIIVFCVAKNGDIIVQLSHLHYGGLVLKGSQFFGSYSELLSKFGDISFKEYLSKGISHPVFYGDLVYKLRRVKDTPNFISSGSNSQTHSTTIV